jgi:uncharacterized membrane protein
MIKDKIIEILVKIRISFTYVALAILIPISWVVFHRTGLVHIDNDDMTYLNLTLSIMAEVQGVILLIYTSKISKQQSEIENKIDEMEESTEN